jgi:hypothetical protein
MRDRFPWGKVIAEHRIGDYLIIEYFGHKFNGPCQVFDENGKPAYENVPSFHTYIKGKDTNRSYPTLDQALVGTIADRYEGLNSRAADYFWKMVSK